MTTNNSLALVEEQRLISVMGQSLYPGASKASIELVLDYCKARGLDPMQKPVHIVPMWDSKANCNRDVVMPGLNLYRTQAAESGCLAGISEPEFGPIYEFNIGGMLVKAPEYAKVSVTRLLKSGDKAVFTAIEYFEEAVSTNKEGKPTAMWKKRPRGMLSKTAESQALRKAFPDIAGSQETAEEMDGKSYYDDQSGVQQAQQADSPEMLAIAEDAFNEAQKGMEAYKVFWKQITQEQRQFIQKQYPQGLAKVAQEADAKKEAEADVVDVEPVKDNGITQNPDGTYHW